MYRNPPPPPVSHLSVSQPKSHRQLSPIGGDRRAKENYYHDLETESMRDSNHGRKSIQSRRSRFSRYEGFSGTSSVHSVTAQIITNALISILLYIFWAFQSCTTWQSSCFRDPRSDRIHTTWVSPNGRFHLRTNTNETYNLYLKIFIIICNLYVTTT